MAEKGKTDEGIHYRKDLFYRSMDIVSDDRAVNVTAEDRTLDNVSFSSQAPVRRWFGWEILSHDEGAVDLRGLKTVLFNHNPDRILGPVRRKRVENGIGVAGMRFDETQDGEQARVQVNSGSLRGSSVGYSYAAKNMRELGPEEEYTFGNGMKFKTPKNERAFVVQKWRAHEFSLTPIPADSSVGIGRDATHSIDGSEEERALFAEMDKRDTEGGDAPASPEKENRNAPPSGAAEIPGGNEMTDEERKKELEQALANKDTEHRTAMKRVYDRASAVGQGELAFRLMAEGRNEDEITSAVFEAVAKERGKSGAPEGGDGDGAKDGVESIDGERLLEALTNPIAFITD